MMETRNNCTKPSVFFQNRTTAKISPANWPVDHAVRVTSNACSTACVFITIIFTFLFTIPLVDASSGDNAWVYNSCLAVCKATGCAQYNDKTYCSTVCNLPGMERSRPTIPTADTWLHVARWDCPSDCSYLCMWLIEDEKKAKKTQKIINRNDNLIVEKYHGKWPFKRAFGAQEPASVLFSIANFLANLWCVIDLTKNGSSNAFLSLLFPAKMKPQQAPATSKSVIVFNSMWILHFVLACNAWLCSTTFHWRDTKLTERLDYFSAGALIAFDLVFSIARVFQISSLQKFALIGAPIFIGYAIHVHKMLTVLFDYGFHVTLCIGAGAVQTAIWTAWSVATRNGRSHPGRRYLLYFMAAINIAMLLEVLDFPPWYDAIDAHALWHAATVPLTFVWYRFVAVDIQSSAALHPTILTPLSQKQT